MAAVALPALSWRSSRASAAVYSSQAEGLAVGRASILACSAGLIETRSALATPSATRDCSSNSLGKAPSKVALHSTTFEGPRTRLKLTRRCCSERCSTPSTR